MTSYQDLIDATSGVTHHWKFEGNGNDSIGSSTLTIPTGYTTSSAGKHGNGLTANSSAKLGPSVSGLATVFNSAYSVEMMFKLTGAVTQELMRVNDEIAWEMNTNGTILFYIVGTTQTTSGSYNNNAWHHLVVTRDSSRNVLVYIDGTQVLSFQHANASTTTGTTYFAGSQYTGQAFISGQMDEVALYNVVLSSTAVTAHKNAAFGTDLSYTAGVMTASADFPGGLKAIDRTVTAGVLSASADVANGRYAYKGTVSLTQNAVTDTANSSFNSNSGASLLFGGTKQLWMKPATLPTGTEVSTVVRLNTTASFSQSTFNIDVYAVNGSWTQSGITDATKPTTTFLRTIATGSIPANGFFDVDITGSGANGVMLATTTSESVTSRSSGGGPVVTYVVAAPEPASVNPVGAPFTADASMPTAAVSVQVGVAYTAGVMTASADMPTPVVTGVRHASLTAEPMYSDAEMTNSLFSAPVTVTVNPIIATAETEDATSGTTDGVLYFADTMGATASWIRPTVNGSPINLDESEDDYFNRVFAAAPSVWQRLNDRAGNTAVDRMGRYNGIYHNIEIGRFDAPDGRPSVRFTGGSYIEQVEPTGSNTDEAWIQDQTFLATTLEFSFRTNLANTFLMAGADSTQTSQGVVSAYAARQLFLKNGKLTFQSRIFAGTPDQIDKEFTGVRNLADGDWHHVVVRSGIYNRGEWGVELWIDGKFEIRRFNANGFMGFPDYIGDRPSNIDGSELEQLPQSQTFVGDMSEVVFYNHNNISSTTIARNYYAFMGWKPVQASPMEATADTANATGRGNRKKALYLYWSPTGEVFGGLPGQANQPVAESQSFDPMPGFVERAFQAPNVPFTYEERRGEFFGLAVSGRSVRVNVDNTAYRDPLTDNQSLINLEHDVDLTQFDVIMFKDWPDEGYELDDIEYNYPGQKQRLLDQLRAANDAGVGLYVTNPRLAADLGIVDRFDFVPTLRERKNIGQQGNASGYYDYKTAIDFPWNIVASDGLTGGSGFAAGIGEQQVITDSYLSNKAFYYFDTNANNRFRVRALIEGLTDIPSYMLDKAVWHADFDQFGWSGAAYKYLERLDGLELGDEYIFNGSAVVDPAFLDITEVRYNRFNGMWATPPGHVLAGTIVTTFGAKHWVEKSQVDNPYKDYATTIVLEPGDSLQGRPVGGRIFVNFTELPSEGLGFVRQILPSLTNGVKYPNGYPAETELQRSWDYSWTRTSLSITGQQSTSSVAVTMPDGTVSILNLGNSSDLNLSMVRSNQLFPLEGLPHTEMDGRGILWLATTPEINAGDKTVRTTGMAATAEMPSPVVRAEKSTQYKAQPMFATAKTVAPAEAPEVDAVVNAFPMEASAGFTGFGKTISAAPMTAQATLPDFTMVHASGEQVVLTLRGTDITLYIKEDA